MLSECISKQRRTWKYRRDVKKLSQDSSSASVGLLSPLETRNRLGIAAAEKRPSSNKSECEGNAIFPGGFLTSKPTASFREIKSTDPRKRI